jgi:hypothetical protein
MENASLPKVNFEAAKMKVTTTPTADFVFEDSYQLPDLASVENTLKKRNTYPKLPQLLKCKKRVNIGDFQIKLLQKIEELTLYSIEQNKQNKEQQERIQKLEEQIKSYSTNKLLIQQKNKSLF